MSAAVAIFGLVALTGNVACAYWLWAWRGRSHDIAIIMALTAPAALFIACVEAVIISRALAIESADDLAKGERG